MTATRQGTSGAVTVDLALSGGTATSGTDYAVWTLHDITIADGQTSGSVTLTFTGVDDELVEGSESIIVSGTATGATVGDAIITIIDAERAGPVITGLKTGPWSDTGEGTANRIPVASSLFFGGGSLGVGGSFAWNEQPPLGSGAFFSDPDGDALTYSAAAERPALVGVSLSGAAGSAVLTASLLNQGASKVFYTASDAYGGQVTREASVTVTAKTSREILEGSPAGTAVGDPVTGTPYNGVALSYSLEGKAKDSGLFVIDSGTGQISVAEGAVLDYDTDDTHREIETYNGEVFAKFYRGEVHYTVDGHDSVINVLIGVNERKFGKPGAPTLTRTEFSEPKDPALDATWTAADDNGLVVTGYEARYRKKAAQGESAAGWTDYTGALSATATTLNLPGLEAGATYEMQVRARGRTAGSPDITLSVNPVSLAEPTTSGSVTVTATRQGTSGAVTVDLALAGGTATSGTDYSVQTLPDITIADGSASGSANLTFTAVDDALVEGSESIIVTGTATGATVGDAIITIIDNEQAGPVITGVRTGPWSDVGEGTANRPPVASGVSFLDGTLGMGGSFAWHEQALLGSGAFFSDPDSDALTYSASAEHAALVGVSLSGGAGSAVLTANLLNQGASKVFYVASDGYGGQVKREASLTVTAKTSRDILEGSPAGTAVGDPVTGTPFNGVALVYTLKGKAKDSGLFVIDSGTGQISVAQGAVLDYDTDDTHRETETYNGEVLAKFYRGEVHYTVDGHASVINVLIRVNERELGKPGEPSLTRTEFTEPTDPALDVTWTAADDSGLVITGYEARFRKKAPQGETPAEWTDYTGALSATATSLNLAGLEAGATYEVQLRARGRTTGDPDITLSANPVSLAEPTASGGVTVTATRQGSSGAVTVDLALSGGTATSGTDYSVGTLPDITIADGSTSGSANLTFTISDDQLAEGSESIIVTGTATGVTVGDAIITIIDDERAGPVITGVRTGPWSDTGEGMTNRPPIASGVFFGGGSLGVGGSFAWHEAAPLGSGAFFSDPDDDALTYAASAESPALVGVSLSGAAGSAVLTANLLNQGASKVSYVASDAYGGQVTRTASLTVTAKTSREVLDGSPAGTAVGAPVTGTPYNNVTLVYTLKGKAKDSGLFVIDSGTGQISVAEGAVLDYDAADGEYRETETHNGQVIAKFYRGEVHYTVDGHASVINVLIKVNERKFGKPGAPTLSRTEFSEPTDPALDVTWTAADDNGLTITGYEAQYRKKAAQGEDPARWTAYTGALSATATSLNLAGLEAGATYEVQVRAVGRISRTSDIALSVNPSSLAEPTTSGSVTVTATRQGSSGAVTVDLALSGGKATSGTDYSVGTLPDITIADGSTSGSANLTLTISDDDLVEGSESIIVTGTATGVSVGNAIITIIDDERPGPVITGVRTGPWSDAGEGTANRPPVASGVSFGGGSLGMGGEFAWHEAAPLGSGAFFSDADRDALTYSASAERPALVGVSLSGNPGSAVLTANLLNQGSSKVSYVASDAYGGQVTRTASLTVTAKTSREITEGSPAGTAVGDPVTGTPYNNVALSYTLKGKAKDSGLFVIDSGTGQISVAEGAVFDYDAEDGEYRETETHNGQVIAKFYRGEVHYTVNGHASVINVIIKLIENSPPVITDPGDKSYVQGTAITAFAIEVSDTDGDTVTVTVTGLPDGLSYDATTKKVSGTVARSATVKDYTATISADDGTNTAVTETFTVTVTSAPTGVTLSAVPSSLGEDDGETSVTVTATFAGGTLPGSTVVTIGTLSGSATKDTDYTVGTSLASITIPANSASGSGIMKITPTDDQVVEGDETITIPGSTTTAVGLSVASASVTLTDDDKTTTETPDDKDSAVLSISGPGSPVAEGSDASFTVTLSAAVAAEVKVAWSAPKASDAAVGSDLSATSGTVTFAAGSAAGATQTITITATDDALSEAAEGFTVTLGTITSTLSEVSLKSGANSATATISASDPITVNITGPSSVDEGDATTSYTVSLSPTGVTPTADLTVSYGTANGTATAGTDYTAKSGTLTFTQTAAGSQTFTVQTTEDDVDEGTGETFTVSISSPSGGGGPTPSLATSATVTTTITDDDDAPSGITLSASPSSLGEDDGETSVTVTATLNGATLPGSTTVTIGTLSGGATKDTDYTVGTSLASITIPANTDSGTGIMKITPTDDAIVEGDESITIPGSTSNEVGLSVTSATVTLTDDDKTTTETPDDKDSAVLSISGPGSPVAEGSDASFTVTLSKSVAAEVSVAWSAPKAADAAVGSDLSATSGTVTFAANSAAGATQTITITATDDKLSETAEGFTVTLGTITSTLSSQVGLKNGASSATATISASDPITVNISGPSSVDEGDATTNYTVSLSPAGVTPTSDLTVSYGTAAGTATSGTDFTAKSGTLTFTQTAAGSQTFTVQTTEDDVDEGTGETFTVSISSPSGGGGPTPSLNTAATVTTTITDDDDASGITLSASPSSLGEDDGETSVTVTATLNGSTLPGSTTVTIGTLSGGATKGTDYTVGTSLASITIPANTGSGTGIMKITPTDDAVVEGDESITIPGSTTTEVGLSVTSASVTLTDDDKTTTETPDDKDSAVLSISGPASAVAEGSDASFTVTLSKSVAAEVKVGWSAPLSADAAEDSDLSATSGTVTFAANSAAGATKTITITATDDKLSETAETFTVTLGTITSTLASQISLASSAKAATGTISASDPITVSISGPSTVDEGDATTNYTVSLSPAGVTPTSDLTVSYGTAAGTATSGTDFTAKSGTLTFTSTAAGSQTFTVQTAEDDVDEGTGETFTVSISSPSGGGGPAPSLGTAASVTTTISDDDDASGITLSVNPSSLGEDDGETSVTVTATLAGATLPGSTTVTIGTLSGGATKGTDYTATTLSTITIPAASSSGTGTLKITPTDDAVVEGDESITIPGSTSNEVGLSVTSASVTLTDDDKTTTETPDDKDSAVLSISGPTSAVAEGSDASFTVTLSKSVAAEVKVAWSAPLGADSAEDADLSATSGTVTFAANSAAGATKTITITATEDKLSETSEGFTVTLGAITSTLSSQVGLKNGASSATATISASEPITINISGPSSVDEGDATTNYTVSLSPAGVIPTSDLTVSYGTANGTATAGTDFTAKSGTLTFTSTAAGSQTFSVQTTEDNVDEGTGETFTVSISSPSGGGGPTPSLNTSATVTTTITDDDDASGITLSASPSSLGEDDGETSVTVTATLAGATLPGSTTVTIGTLSGGATKDTDYTVGTSLASITIPANTDSGTGIMKITPTDDAIVEGDESITIPGSTSNEVGLSVTSATVTLTDDDKTTTETPDDKDSAVLSISGPGSPVAEGSDASFTVTLSKSVAAEVSVAWSAPKAADAAVGSDLSATSGTVTFAANSAAGATQTITITATDDKLSETAEGFTVTLGTITSTLSSQVGLKNGASSATATISASDPITVNISGPSSVDEGDATTNYTVSLSPAGVTPTSDLTVSYGTAAGTATSGTDFTAKSGTLTFTQTAAGSQTFTVQTTEDDVDEGTGETFTVSISSPSGGGGPTPSLNTAATVTTTITDDDDASGITLSASPSSLGEDDGETSVTVTATLNGSTLPGSTTVTIGTLSGGATKGTDYTVGTSLASITIPANTGSGTGIMKITPTDDAVVEGDESITIPGSTTTEVGLSVTSASVTLTDDDKTTTETPDDKDSAVLSISGPASAVAEGSDASFTVTLSKSVAAEVKVGWSAPLSADAAEDSDLSATSGTVTFAANSAAGATKTITITATDDKLSETAETFTVTLGTITSTLASQISLASSAKAATGTISASDPITVSISGPSTVDEGDATTNYTVSLSPAGVTPTSDLTVSYGTAAGTATSGTDFTAKSGTLTFTSTAAGSQTFTVQTAEDDVDEGTGETFTVSISSPSGGGGPAPSLGTAASVTTTISDDDDASGITLSVNPSSLGEDDGETSVTVTATLAGATLPGSTTVTIGTLSGGATKGTDYTATTLSTITIPAASSSGTGTLKITPTDDAVVEGDESITIPGSTSNEVGLSVTSASVTLTDDDKTTTETPDDKDSAVLSISGPTSAVAEGSDASFTVTLSKSVAAEVKVAWSAPLGADSAEDADLSATSGTVTFAANSAAGATKTITITATEDKLSETSEGFTVTLGAITSTLSSQVGLKNGASSATATISASEPITINISGPSSVDEGDATTNYTVSLSPAGVIPTSDLTVSYGTANGTATAGTDFTAKSGTLTFTSTAAGSQTFSVQTTEDNVDEGTGETFTVSISSPSGGGGPTPSLNTSATVTTTITDDDDASGITLSASPSSLGEDDGETSVTVTATLAGGVLPGSTVVTIGTLSGGATEDTDYTVGTSLASITIPANTASGTGTMKITPTDDAVVEGDESITIPGSTSNEVGLSVTSASVTLTDDDKTTTGTPDDKDGAVLSISGPSSAVAEGSEASFTVTLSKSVAAEVSVGWSAPLSADAAEGSDLSATSGTVTFAANSAAGATKTITITATDDKLSETSEGFTVTLGTITSTLSSQLSLASSAKAATATISASDPITVNISGPSSVDEGDATTNYTVSLSPTGVTPTADLTVSYGTAGGTATSGTDFTAKSGTLTFTSTAAGSQTFSVQTTEDGVDEGTGETFTVSISSPSGGGGPTPSLATGASVTTTISDDDDASGITLSANPSSLGEDDGETSVTVTATLNGATLPGSTVVTIGTLSGGATDDTDYSVGTALASITIPANTASGTGIMKITPTDDAVVEGDESITIPGSTSTEVGLSVTSATVTLTDDDKTTTATPDDKDSAVLSISGPSAAVAEGSDASFTVTLSRSVAAEVQVAWSAPLGADSAEGADLSATSGTVKFAANSAAGATKTITITATDDKLSETSEGFTVTLGTITSTLSSQVGLKNGASSATATISASDPITVNISGPSTVDEGDATTNFTVSLSPSGVIPTADLTVSYGTANGTAAAGSDFTAKSGTLTFTSTAAGSQTFSVQTTEDDVDEGTGETFTVSISSPSGGGGPAPSLNTSATVTTTITDDDDASGITLSASPSSLGEDDGETSVTVTATLNGGTLPGSTVVTIGTLSGGATKGTDYSVGTSLASITIPANTASGTGTMKITPIDDAVVEGDESITIPGSTTTAVGLSVTSASVTLTDDDKTTPDKPDDKDSVVLSVSVPSSGPALTVAEGSDVSFTVTLSAAIAAKVDVAWSAPLSTDAAEGSDLSATSGTVTFAAGSAAGATQTITITATDDKLSETAEGFTVTLGTITSTLSEVSLKSGASSATATILASDPITVNISGPSSVDEGDATGNYTVSLSPSGVTPTSDLTVNYATANGTATAGTDYTAKSGTLTFTSAAAGSQTFKVQTTEDVVDEGTGETFTVSISSPSGGGGPAPSLAKSPTVTTTITDDDDAPSGVTLSAVPSSLGEDDAETSLTVTAKLNGSTLPGSTTVTIGTLSGSATKDTDYTVGTSLASITIPATTASWSGTMKITPTDDTVVEGDETITIPGSTTTAVGLSVTSATVTLTDSRKAPLGNPNDEPPAGSPGDTDGAVLSISGPASAVAEGSDASFTVTLSESVAAEVKVAWSAPLAADAAIAADLSATSGTVTFAANSAAGATKTIKITATDDKLSETSEGFTVTLGTITSTLSSQISLKSGASSATATISASDAITVNISGPSSVDEGDSTTSYTVSLSPTGVTPTADLTVSYGTANGTATAGTDYTAKSGTLTFTQTAAGSQTFKVQTTEDNVDEGTGETFTVSISSPSGGGGPTPSLNTSASVTTTITDDDDAPSGITLSAVPSSLGEDDGETSVTVTATLNGSTLPGSTVVTIGTLSGGATKDTDYTVGTSLASITISANTASGTGIMKITPTDDSVVEGDESITIPGSTTTAVGLSVASASVTLTDDDKTTAETPDDNDSAVLSISGPSAAVAEGSDAEFVVTLSKSVAAEVSVGWSAPLGTDAAEGSDLSATSGTVTFAANSAAGATKTITITATDDRLSETSEGFTVTLGTITSTLSSQISLKSGASSATATISESDPITVSLSGSSSVTEGDSSSYTITLTPQGVIPTADLLVDYTTADGTASAGEDYVAKSGTLTFTRTDAAANTVTITTIADAVEEGDETFSLTITNPRGGGGPPPAVNTTVTTNIRERPDPTEPATPTPESGTVPEVADVDPTPDYTPTFDACVNAASEPWGFVDVPAEHPNADDIHCIAYYGITIGTGDGSTYSPSGFVPRWQVALFLTRMARRVGIEVPATPDIGFTDIGDLAYGTQASIKQLMALGITRGTTPTTYAPHDVVTRGQMALFIARLMNLVTPLTDGDPAMDDTTFYGYTPSLVAENEEVKVRDEHGLDVAPEIKSPYTDLGSIGGDMYSAITQLYELGVVTGLTSTTFGSSDLITRASTAEFLAGALAHSNVRPAGLSIQADNTADYGEYVATMLISVRDDEFGPVTDGLVDIFQNNCADICGEDAHFITSGTRAGRCNGRQTVGDCVWGTDDHKTDRNGNIHFEARIGATPAVEGTTSRTHTVYAWIGSEPGDVFDLDDDDYVSAAASWIPVRDSVAVTTSISSDAADGVDRTTTGAPTDSGKLVHLGSTGSVLVTGQLIDASGAAANQGGVEVRVGWTRYAFDRGPDGADVGDSFVITYENIHEATRTTSDDGTVTFTVSAPRDVESDTDQDVVDLVTFTVDADGKTDGTANTVGSVTFNWVEDTPVYQKTAISATEYVLVDGDGDGDDADISVSARLLDQYGEGIRLDDNGNAYRITLALDGNGSEHFTDIDPDTPGVQATSDVVKTPSIRSGSGSRGMAAASFSVNDIARTTHSLDIAYRIAQAQVDSEGLLVDGDPQTDGVQIIYQSLTGATASGTTAATNVYVAATDGDGDGRKITVHQTFGGNLVEEIPATHFATEGSGADHGVLYAMDDNDTYVNNGESTQPCVAFRPQVGDVVRVVVYSRDKDGASIYDITPHRQLDE